MTKIRQWSTLAVCALFLFGLPLWHLLSPDEEFSKSAGVWSSCPS